MQLTRKLQAELLVFADDLEEAIKAFRSEEVDEASDTARLINLIMVQMKAGSIGTKLGKHLETERENALSADAHSVNFSEMTEEQDREIEAMKQVLK